VLQDILDRALDEDLEPFEEEEQITVTVPFNVTDEKTDENAQPSSCTANFCKPSETGCTAALVISL
jgi:hypothetical protein